MIKAIDTVYKGYRFRSRLEARWAVFFDTLGIPYEYEKEGFDLGSHGFYLPDFWLPKERVWFEVKGERPTEEYMSKMRAFRDQSEQAIFICTGLPDNRDLLYMGWYETSSEYGVCDDEGMVILSVRNGAICFGTYDCLFDTLPRNYFRAKGNPLKTASHEESRAVYLVHDAEDAAKQARFEHGTAV